MDIEPSPTNTTKHTISRDTYPGYPTERLVIETIDSDTNLTLPDGPWSASINTLPSNEKQIALRQSGYELDDIGRPLHPWLRDMITDPDVGVVTGLGEYWHWGPNRTADPIVMNDDPTPKILLIQRGDTGSWALPGGFIDDQEHPATAAKRELLEETGLLLVGENGQEIYTGVVADARTTAHAWAETSAILWHVEGTPNVVAGDDAHDAGWFAIDQLPDILHGSHAILIEQAVDAARSNTNTKQNHTISLPHEITAYEYANGGHMAYHHLRATTKHGKQIFMKAHDKHMFTDTEREAHSRQYLAKEMRMFDHVRGHGFASIPDSVELVDGHTLIMDSMGTGDGWHWEAPGTHYTQYVTDTLSALEHLASISLPDDFHDTLLPTFVTHETEGWKAISSIEMERITTKLSEWKDGMRPNFRETVPMLLADLPKLQHQSSALSAPSSYVLAHHDFRQANIAWHPDQGAKIVDWSWAGVGRANSDATTFLIDLHKSGHSVMDYMDHFNPGHALTLIGFWLAHSLWQTREGDATVRFHQAVSAISAYDLLVNYRNSGDVTQSQFNPKN